MTRKQQQQQKFNDKFLLLLEEQYAFVEEYANAQTFMLNATMTTSRLSSSRLSSSSSSSTSSSSSPDEAVINAIERLDKARSNVRSNMKDLQEQEEIQIQIQKSYNNNNEHEQQQQQQQQNHQRYYTKNHINLSRRVIETISNNPSWHSNGLPKPTTSSSIDNDNNSSNNSLQTNTIAIAALKASIARIREIEETI